MLNHNGKDFEINDKVKLKKGIMTKKQVAKGREANTTAKIVSFLQDEEGNLYGGVYLDRDLMGMRYWNIDDMINLSRGGQ